jgi:hypothetical protein
MAWNVVNLFYPFWGWINFASLWMGFVLHPPIFWIIDRLILRSFIAAKFRHTDHTTSGKPDKLKHLGFLYSVWENTDSLILGYYHQRDRIFCPKRRLAILACERYYTKWIGWLRVLSTDVIPFAVLIALLCVGYFFGVSSVVFFAMGLILTLQIETLLLRFQDGPFPWKDEMFLNGKMCKSEYLGVMTCVLEGPDDKVFLTLIIVAMHDEYTRQDWFKYSNWGRCACCTLASSNIPSEGNV